MTAYWIKTKGELLGMKYAGNAQCINMEGIYLAGEPHTNSQASLIIGFEHFQDTSMEEKALHDLIDSYFNFLLHVSFN